MKIKLQKAIFDFGKYKVILDDKGNAWVNGKYVCQFIQIRISQVKAKSAIDKYLSKK